MSTRLSELESSQSSSDDEFKLVGDEDADNGFQTMNERKRGYKQKRKKSLTPSKETF